MVPVVRMDYTDFSPLLASTVEALSDCSALKERGFFRELHENDPLPSGEVLEEVIALCRSLLFPGFYGRPALHSHSLSYRVGVETERLYELLYRQVRAVLCFSTQREEGAGKAAFKKRAERVAGQVIAALPRLREMLAEDVEAAFNGDPAATDYGEIICCYPIIKTLINYRVAHELYRLEVPLLPRMLCEMAHSETGIDIHPGAQIGHYFTIDHGTGVVIGATSIIGNHVKLYQGVTLGAKSFPLDADGHPIKGIPRHPILEDDVIVYSNASILGRIRIGRGAVIGGNVWVTEDVPPHTRLLQSKNTKE